MIDYTPAYRPVPPLPVLPHASWVESYTPKGSRAEKKLITKPIDHDANDDEQEVDLQ